MTGSASTVVSTADAHRLTGGTAEHRSDDLLKSLRVKALHGTFWTVFAYGGAMALRLVSNIILTRLLMPQYFGLMALLTTLITGLTLFSDLGLTPNIVRSSRGDQPAFLNTAWTMQVMRGLALWIGCLAVAIPFARFYDQPAMTLMIPVIGLSLVISSFNSTTLSSLSRGMAVRELAFIDLSIQAAQLAVTVAAALAYRSVWALIAGRLFSDLARLAISHVVLRGHRPRFQWEREAVKELFAFGRWVVFSTALTFLASQSDRLILGKLVSLQTLGLYGIAFTLADIPRQIILSFCSNIVFPFVSKLSHLPRAEFFALVLKHRRSVLMSAAGLLSVVVTFGDQFIVHIYDSRYHSGSWMIPILASGLWHTLLYATTTACLFAIGRPQYIVMGYLFSAIAILALTPLAFAQWGMKGALFVVAFSDLPMYAVTVFGMNREGMFQLAQDFKASLLFVAFCGVLVALRLAVGPSFPHAVALR